MEAGNYDISKLLKTLYDRVDGIGERTFTSDRPKAVPDKMERFVVVELPVRLSDRHAYGETTARVRLYVRDKPSGVEDVEKAAEMQREVFRLFPWHADGYQFGKPVTIPMGSDGNGFHIYAMQINVIIL